MKRGILIVVAVATFLFCSYEAWEFWGLAGLAVAIPVALLAVIVGVKTFSPR